MPPHGATQGRQTFTAVILQRNALYGLRSAPGASSRSIPKLTFRERLCGLARPVIERPIHGLMVLRNIFLTHIVLPCSGGGMPPVVILWSRLTPDANTRP